jgi:phosphatidylglycerophosphatase A
MVSTTSPERSPVATPVRADSRFMRRRLSRLVALGFGSGLSPVAPGTVGTLWAWLTYVVVGRWLDPAGWAVVIGVAAVAGVWACGKTARDLGVADHGAIVWDEIVAFWLVLLFVPAGFAAQFAAFVAFRFFDIVKPPPIRHFDAKLKSGFGVMFDDLLAAAYTLLLFAFWYR